MKGFAPEAPTRGTRLALRGVETSFKFDRFIENPWIGFTGHFLDGV
jgi:hypothetical protein